MYFCVIALEFLSGFKWNLLLHRMVTPCFLTAFCKEKLKQSDMSEKSEFLINKKENSFDSCLTLNCSCVLKPSTVRYMFPSKLFLTVIQKPRLPLHFLGNVFRIHTGSYILIESWPLGKDGVRSPAGKYSGCCCLHGSFRRSHAIPGKSWLSHLGISYDIYLNESKALNWYWIIEGDT